MSHTPYPQLDSFETQSGSGDPEVTVPASRVTNVYGETAHGLPFADDLRDIPERVETQGGEMQNPDAAVKIAGPALHATNLPTHYPEAATPLTNNSETYSGPDLAGLVSVTADGQAMAALRRMRLEGDILAPTPAPGPAVSPQTTPQLN